MPLPLLSCTVVRPSQLGSLLGLYKHTTASSNQPSTMPAAVVKSSNKPSTMLSAAVVKDADLCGHCGRIGGVDGLVLKG